jgi:hypothetical protein
MKSAAGWVAVLMAAWAMGSGSALGHEPRFRGRTTPQWVEVLHSPRPEERRAAMEALQSLGDRAQQAAADVARALTDLDEPTAAAAYRWLVTLGPKAAPARDVLLEYEQDLDVRLRSQAAKVLVLVDYHDERDASRLALILGTMPLDYWAFGAGQIIGPRLQELPAAARHAAARELLPLIRDGSDGPTPESLIGIYALLSKDAEKLDEEWLAFLNDRIGDPARPGWKSVVQIASSQAALPGGKQIREHVVPKLEPLLEVDDSIARVAAEALVSIGHSDEIAPHLLVALKTQDSRWALEQLAKVGPAATSILGEIEDLVTSAKPGREPAFLGVKAVVLVLHSHEGAISDSKWDGKVGAYSVASALASIGGNETALQWRDRILDANVGVASVAIELAEKTRTHDDATVAALIKACAAKDRHVRMAAVHALGKLGKDASQAEAVLERMAATKGEENEVPLRIAACLALWRVNRSPVAVKTLGDLVLVTSSGFQPQVNHDAVAALHELGADAEPAVAQLVKAIDREDNRYMRRVIDILSTIGPKAAGAEPALRRIMASEDDSNGAAAYALWRVCGSTDGLDILAKQRNFTLIAAMGPDARSCAPRIAADIKKQLELYSLFDRESVESALETLRKIDPGVAESLAEDWRKLHAGQQESQLFAKQLRAFELQMIEVAGRGDGSQQR